MPKVSVVIPTYNRKAFVQEAIDSVLQQTYQDLEIVVVDNNSTDGTPQALIKRYGEQIRVLAYPHSRLVGGSRNTGIRASRGKYIAFLDDDDQWLPCKLQYQVSYLDEHADVDLLCGATMVMLDDGSVDENQALSKQFQIQPGPLSFETVFYRCPINMDTVLVRRDVIFKAGLFDETCHYGVDFDMWTRLALCSKIVFEPEVVAYVRAHDANMWVKRLTQADEVTIWLKDSLKIREKLYLQWPMEMGDVKLVRALVTARTLAVAGSYYFACGDLKRGAACFRQSIMARPESWTDIATLENLTNEYSLSLAYLRGVDAAKEFVQRMYSQATPEMQGVKQSKRRSLSRLYIAQAFFEHQQGNKQGVLANTALGLWYAPTCLRDRDILLRSIQALVGPRPIRYWRRLRGLKTKQGGTG